MKALVVEDESVTRKLLERALTDRGHEVTSCKTGEQAQEFLKNEAFPLLVLDVVLPGMDGLELCRWIRSQSWGEYSYILVGTGCNQPDDLQAVLDSGANDYIPKPFDLPLLQIRLSIAEQQIRDIKRRHEAEVLHQTVLLTAMDGFCIFGADQQLQQVNDAYCQMSGYTRDELLTKKLSDLEAVESSADIQKHIDKVLETGGDRIQTKHRRKDGTLVDVEISIKRLGQQPDSFFAFLHDVTAKNHAEKSLKFRAQAQELAAKIAASFIEVPADEIDSCIDAAIRSLGEFSRADRCSILLFSDDGKIIKLAHEYSAPGIPAQKPRFQHVERANFPWLIQFTHSNEPLRIADVSKLPQQARAEASVLASTGARSLIAYPLLFGRSFLGFIGFVSTTRTNAFNTEHEDLIALTSPIFVHSLQRKQAAVDIEKLVAFPKYNPNLVLEFTPDGKLSYFNAAARQLSLSLGKVRAHDILPPNTSTIVRQCLSSGEPNIGVETKHGARTISWSFYPILAICAVHCYAVEITDRLDIEEQLRQAQKMESIGQLAAGVAHDFNNVLTVIEGHAGLLMAESHLPDDAIESISQIAAASGKAANLTRQLLTFSRRQVIQQKVIDLNTVIQNVTKMLCRILGEDITFQIKYANQLLCVHADAGMMEQVLMNLAVNARDAMPNGGELIVTTSLVEVDETLSQRNPEARPGMFVRLSVSDTGTGIDPANIQRVFEPFFTTKAIVKGTGLGLATVYGISKQHDGWTQVYSELGMGTTFHVYLPAVPSEEKSIDTATAPNKVKTGDERILVVEDEPALRALAGQILRRFGYRVETAETGVVALEVWDSNDGDFDLLLTDMVMPDGISGSELGRRLKEKKGTLKVIYSSGYSQEIADKELTLEEGFNFLQKPYHPMKLAQTVRECLDR
jgi:PAS domain S-box-containing protein